MPILNSPFPNGNYKALETRQMPGLLSLNDVLQESLKKAQAQVDKAQLIVRCEPLPHVQIEHAEMTKVFDDLLNMILNQSLPPSKQFLYVDCEEDVTDVIDMSLSEGMKRYIIKFHTNITTHDNWKLVNNKVLMNCKQILSRHSGNLVVNDISSSGCLFSVSLPGKIE